MKTFAILFLLTLSSLECGGDPRWCAVSAKDASNSLVSPPIARAARVSGVVVMRMVYAPNGKVVRTELVFGPVMLSNSITSQMKDWTVRTNDLGDELCETLVIADFQFDDPDKPLPAIPAQPDSPGILRF